MADDLIEILMPNRGFMRLPERNEISEWCLENLGYWHAPYVYVDVTKRSTPAEDGPEIFAIKIRRPDASLFILRWC